MSESERETAGAVRSAHVAHFIPADWSAIAPRISGALERIDRALGALQLLIIVPDSTGAVALSRELRGLDAADGVTVLPATSAARAERLLKDTAVHVVIGSVHTLADLLRASAIKLGGVQAVVFAAADEYDAASDDLALVMAEVPKTGARLLTATSATAAVEEVLERYMHKARRMSAAGPVDAAATPAPAATVYARTVTADAPLAPLGELLDEMDPPSTAILAADARFAVAARAAIDGLGYTADSALIALVDGPIAPNTALVVFAGIPTAATLASTAQAAPGRMVALVTARQRASLERLPGITVLPWERSRAARDARVREDAMRALIRTTLAAGVPTREVLALEPLLADFDGLAVAAAALRLYEAEKARADAVPTPRAAAGRAEGVNDARAPRESAPSDRPRFDRDARDAKPRERSESGPPRKFDRDRSESGPPRKFDRDSGPPRKFGRDAGPPRERTFGGEARPPRERTFGGEARPPRKFLPDGAPAQRGGFKSGGFKSGARDDRPARGGSASGPRPFTRGPRKDDGGRPPRKTK